MKNGTYIEDFNFWRNCKVYYENDIILYIVLDSGSKIYFNKYRQYHREDGPAIENYDGTQHWYFENKWIDVKNQKDFERYLNTIAFR